MVRVGVRVRVMVGATNLGASGGVALALGRSFFVERQGRGGYELVVQLTLWTF